MKVKRTFYIYILSSKSRRIYVGMTNFVQAGYAT
jgi:predicted GIY-YIG superfamily endonuclease